MDEGELIDWANRQSVRWRDLAGDQRRMREAWMYVQEVFCGETVHPLLEGTLIIYEEGIRRGEVLPHPMDGIEEYEEIMAAQELMHGDN